ncbi:MAG: transposase [Candidatus Thiodiazotropha sp. (ex Lucinoma kastoroae)]|nr:transposase [Candidatus Thiodiazotropha sp. (ex Lucinoma kastoroae)]MCU7861127.1 transposase [Candidatus Thiodiazotropha sp. (ex Lucinoma kastoroae)]
MRDTAFQYRRQSRPTIHDFINEAISQVREGSETITAVADRLGLRQSLLRQWLSVGVPVEQQSNSNEIVESLRQENQALQRECKRLRKALVSVIDLDEKTLQGGNQ